MNTENSKYLKYLLPKMEVVYIQKNGVNNTKEIFPFIQGIPLEFSHSLTKVIMMVNTLHGQKMALLDT